LKDRGVDGRTISKWIFEKWDRGLGLNCSGWGQVAGSCKRSN